MNTVERETAGAPFLPGDPAPWFRAPAIGGVADYAFHTIAGRHVLLLFVPSASLPAAQAALALVRAHESLFDDCGACFFGITLDPHDAATGRLAPRVPGIRYFLDRDAAVSTLYGAVSAPGNPAPAGTPPTVTHHPCWLVLDPALCLVARFPLAEGAQAIATLRRAARAAADQDAWAPVLQVPRVLDAELCRRLIDLYDRHGGEPSGFMREQAGKTVLMADPQHKQRRDCLVEDAALIAELGRRVKRSVVPLVQRAFQFQATRMERYLVGCYAPGEGHFRPHRDNTTRGTAHRRFAVTINLDAESYQGGDLRFPEFGPRTYRAPTGGAIVFSCSLLHEVLPVTSGRRLAFLPFLYDEAAALQREANNPFLGSTLEPYRA